LKQFGLNIYTKKRRWKWFLFAAAVLIIGASLWYTNILVRKIAQTDRQRVRIWADAIQRRAKLVNYTNEFFEKVRLEERKRIEIWAEANKRLISENNSGDLTFYLDITSGNTTIPVILANENGLIKQTKNVTFNPDSVEFLEGELKDEFTKYNPIPVRYFGITDYLYYKDSKLFTELREVLDDLIESFFQEVVMNTASVPVIITDSTQQNVTYFGGEIDSIKIVNDPKYAQKMLNEMASQNKPLRIDLPEMGTSYIFYEDSYLLTQLKFYPYIQFFIIGLFLLISYILFSIARKSEQNQVWVGMAKETAHQLGTPISSMIAWIELLKIKGIDNTILEDIKKDITRLETITDRFSKIGSPPKLDKQNVVKVIYNTVAYIKSRTSIKVNYQINPEENNVIEAWINSSLFEWVIENLCKNAIDAMDGKGTINININGDHSLVNIDITDSGKGIPKSKHKAVFHPGYTSKKRGWGLGLSLSKRIIENYHSGKIFVKTSLQNKGTTMRIVLKK